MKYIKLLLLILPIFSLNILAQSNEMKEICSEADLVDGDVYLLRGYDSVKQEYYDFDGWHIVDDDSLYQFKRIVDLKIDGNKSIGYCNLWKLSKINGHWGLMNLNFGSRFLSSSPNDYNASYSYLKETFDSTCYVQFVGSGNDMKINVGGKDFEYYNTTYYTFYPPRLKKCVNVHIYEMNDPVIQVDENIDLDKISPIVVSIQLNKTLNDSDVNTFIVPFDICDYKKVFGADAQVYLPTNYANYEIIFTELGENDIIKANTPYLLKGTFSKGNYVIKKEKLNYDGNGQCVYHVGELTIHGLYKRKNIGKENSYIFNNYQIKKCINTEHVYIYPYRWYFTSNTEQLDSRLMKLIYDDGQITMINTPYINSFLKKGIYNIKGIKMDCDENQLQHGIYIINGKKIMK